MNAKWLLFQYLTNLKAWGLDLINDPVLQNNSRFKNLHSGERCFILGSGSSIKEQDLTKLSGEIVMTQNHFHAHEDILIIDPAYHVVVPKYQPSEYDNDWVSWLQTMSERLPEQACFFFGRNTKYLIDQLPRFHNRAFFINAGGSVAIAKKAPTDITRRILAIPTVLTECLAIAIFMGFSEICLCGFDLDQLYKKDKCQGRFYGCSPITANQAEIDLDEAAYAVGAEWIQMWTIWQQCILLRQAAKKKGIRIVNATQGGLLNMFERQSYESLL